MASNGIIFHAKFNEHRIAYSKQGKHRQSRSFYLRKEKRLEWERTAKSLNTNTEINCLAPDYDPKQKYRQLQTDTINLFCVFRGILRGGLT